ncbi:B-box zinc finger protein [Myxococcus fulvus]|uniref:B-box zinc finger protein n=1 Tax=Myxococcus fulvus TaxID=33 RepID=UPI003B9BAC40
MVSSVGVVPRCAVHPEEEAGATCQRCGAFTCDTCATWVMGVLYCATCAARPEVNYLEVFRQEHWGQRDANAWTVAGGTLLLVGLAGLAVYLEEWRLVPLLLGAVGMGVAFFLGQSWARPGLVLTPVVGGLWATSLYGPAALVAAFLMFISALQIFLDTRTRLFFRVEVSEKDLRRLWNLKVNNPLARHALSAGISSVFFPLMVPMALVLGLLGLRAVDAQARPPIGRKGQALAGIALGLGALALWGLVLWRPVTQAVFDRLFSDWP